MDVAEWHFDMGKPCKQSPVWGAKPVNGQVKADFTSGGMNGLSGS